MAYEDLEDGEGALTAEELLVSVRLTNIDLYDRFGEMQKQIDDTTAVTRAEILQSRREMIEVRSALGRLQNRFDNQLWILLLGNVASGIGVAALILGATSAFK